MSSDNKCNDGYCSNLRSFLMPKSQLVRYTNRETMGNNDKQMNDVLLFLRPMREHLTSSSIIAVFFFFLIALKIIHSVFS